MRMQACWQEPHERTAHLTCDSPAIVSRINEPDVNICIWQRPRSIRSTNWYHLARDLPDVRPLQFKQLTQPLQAYWRGRGSQSMKTNVGGRITEYRALFSANQGSESDCAFRGDRSGWLPVFTQTERTFDYSEPIWARAQSGTTMTNLIGRHNACAPTAYLLPISRASFSASG